MKTAVEWLAEHLCNEPNFDYWRAVEQAKEMEKEQVIKAYDSGYNEFDIYRNGQNYYNETFKSE
jgi:hypothetical protein